MRLRMVFAVGIACLFMASPAFAYRESTATPDPDQTPSWACPTCHGLDSSITSPTIEPTRKGPHGAFTIDTNKCAACHRTHTAVGAIALLPTETILGLCETCHDGTGAGGVYGVIYRRTGEPAYGHEIGSETGTETVPGGDPSGGSLDRAFASEDGGLICTSCHDPHDGRNTVEPFIGDRVRSVEDTNSSAATNRLLRARPASAEDTVTVYGTEWCESCHPGSAAMGHEVGRMDTTGTPDYSNVLRVTGYDTQSVTTTTGPLGGNNFGYVMPSGYKLPGDPDRPRPICQQCHEDARAVGNIGAQQVSSYESFRPTVDGYETVEATGNPRFQNFPHETQNPYMLLEYDRSAPDAATALDSLCTNCHDVTTDDRVHD